MCSRLHRGPQCEGPDLCPTGFAVPACCPCPPTAHGSATGQCGHTAVPSQRGTPPVLPLVPGGWAAPAQQCPEPAARQGPGMGTGLEAVMGMRSWDRSRAGMGMRRRDEDGDVGVSPTACPQVRSCTSPTSNPPRLVSMSAPAATCSTATPAAPRSSSPVGHGGWWGGDWGQGWGWGSAFLSVHRDPHQAHHCYCGGEEGAESEAWG